jgi:hypothetical protein
VYDFPYSPIWANDLGENLVKTVGGPWYTRAMNENKYVSVRDFTPGSTFALSGAVVESISQHPWRPIISITLVGGRVYDVPDTDHYLMSR